MSTDTPSNAPVYDPYGPDAWDEYREIVPDDDELAIMSDGELLDLASAIPILDERAPRKKLEQQLGWFRDGGVPIHHDRDSCGNTWVYRGESDWYVTCSKCRSSTMVQGPDGQTTREQRE